MLCKTATEHFRSPHYYSSAQVRSTFFVMCDLSTSPDDMPFIELVGESIVIPAELDPYHPWPVLPTRYNEDWDVGLCLRIIGNASNQPGEVSLSEDHLKVVEHAFECLGRHAHHDSRVVQALEALSSDFRPGGRGTVVPEEILELAETYLYRSAFEEALSRR